MSVKKHFKNNQKIYFGIAIGVGVAGITWVIVRRVTAQPISLGTSETTQTGISVLGQRVVIKDSTLNNVSYISSERSGPPSWVVRCKETDQVFTSQRNAALAMELSQSEISKHLNGVMDDVRGFTFERICMAA